MATSEWHVRGHRFDPDYLHQVNKVGNTRLCELCKDVFIMVVRSSRIDITSLLSYSEFTHNQRI